MKSGLTTSNISDAVKGLKKFPRFLGLHAFSFILLFILIDIILGIGLFYQYAILADVNQAQIAQGTIKFDNPAYQQIIKDWQASAQAGAPDSAGTYQNPFMIGKISP